MRIIRLSLPSRNKRDKAWLTDQTRFWAAPGNPPYQSQGVVLPERRSPVFVPVLHAPEARCAARSRRRILSRRLGDGMAVDKARFPARVCSSPFLGPRIKGRTRAVRTWPSPHRLDLTGASTEIGLHGWARVLTPACAGAFDGLHTRACAREHVHAPTFFFN